MSGVSVIQLRRDPGSRLGLVTMLLLLGCVPPPPTTQAKIMTQQSVAGIDSAARLFEMDQGQWPTTLAQLVPRYLDGAPGNDPWGTPYVVTLTPGTVKVTSLGADGRIGGAGANADIVSDSSEFR